MDRLPYPNLTQYNSLEDQIRAQHIGFVTRTLKYDPAAINSLPDGQGDDTMNMAMLAVSLRNVELVDVMLKTAGKHLNYRHWARESGSIDMIARATQDQRMIDTVMEGCKAYAPIDLVAKVFYWEDDDFDWASDNFKDPRDPAP